MKIQHITISDESEKTVTAEIQISESAEIDDSASYIVARITLPKPTRQTGFVSMKLRALRDIHQLIDRVAAEIEQSYPESH